jgi:TATA-box binding protein (TBP) (component of TFIID and TFIIIB)
MPIDPSIAMGFRNPQIQVQNPVAQYAQAQELNLNALKMQEAQQGMETRNMLRTADPSSPDYIDRVFRADPKLGLELLKGRTEARTAEIDQRTKIGTLLKTYANQVVANPNLETAMLVVQRFGRDTGEDMSAEMARLQTIGNNPDALRKWGMGYAATADQILTQTTITPAQQLTANVQRENQAITREGQRLTHSAATQPVFSEASGGFYTRPTGGKAAEFIPASGTDMTTKGKSVNIAKQNVTTLASEMAQGYKNLLDKKAIKSTEAGAASNLSASSQSSMAGQILGGVFGTEEQDIRDFIKSQRPLLVQAMVKATGMSAQQINSNAELKNMLDAATDPGRGYESNIRALNGLNTMFGTGTPILPSAPVTPAIAPAAKPTLESIFAPAKK